MIRDRVLLALSAVVVATTVVAAAPWAQELELLFGPRAASLGSLFRGIDLGGARAAIPRGTHDAIAAFEREHDAQVTLGFGKTRVEEISVVVPADVAMVQAMLRARWGSPSADLGRAAVWLAAVDHVQCRVSGDGDRSEIAWQRFLRIGEVIDGYAELMRPARMMGMSAASLRRQIARAAPDAISDASTEDTLLWRIPALH